MGTICRPKGDGITETYEYFITRYFINCTFYLVLLKVIIRTEYKASVNNLKSKR